LLDHLMRLVMCVFALFITDHFAIEPFLEARLPGKPKKVEQARWFFTHAFANLFVCITGANSLYTMITDPVHSSDFRVYNDTSFLGTASTWPLTFVNAVHVYHMVGGFSLGKDDYFHHLMFIPALGFPGQVFKWGATENAGAFFISGLPGGIIYFMLGLKYLGLVSNLTEKRVSANLNTWLRLPGILINSWVVYQACIYGNSIAPAWANWLHVILPPYNALFYNKQSIANFSVHYMNNLLSQDKVVKAKIDEMKLGEFSDVYKSSSVLSWQEAIAVPQQGS